MAYNENFLQRNVQRASLNSLVYLDILKCVSYIKKQYVIFDVHSTISLS